jgi:cell division protein FtsI/penicillin-binding protein 2
MNLKIGRSSILIVISLVAFLYLFYVLFKLQVIHNVNYSNIKNKQNEYTSNDSKRGTIFGTRKDGEIVPIAVDEVWYKLVISPRDVGRDYEERLYDLINKVTEIDRETFFQKIKNKKDTYEEIKTISKEEAEKIENLDLQGVLTYKSYKRTYPMKEVGARILGFVGGGENGFVGRYGLEKYYENDLKAQAEVKNTFFSKIFQTGDYDNTNMYAKNIVTSLEPNVMKFINTVLVDMKNTWEADEVSVIVLNSKSGEIIAMDTYPSFDPNNYQAGELKNFSNPSVQGVYELGSIMKPITMAGGIEAGLVTPETVYHDYGFVKVDNFTIKNFDEKVRGDQTMQDVISQSLNTGAVYVEKLLGQDRFKENFDKFGLNDTTNIDFPGEVINKTDNLDTNTEVNFATASFGQGVAITPISMLSSLSIIPNEGRKLCPHFLISKIMQDNSQSSYECDQDIQQVVSTTTANTTKKMMIELIESGLANGRYKDKNYLIGAKTGTAQLPSPDGKYYKDKFIHSYFSFFPGLNPEFTVLIYQVNPKKGMLASLTLAPAANKIKDFLLNYYNVPPDR